MREKIRKIRDEIFEAAHWNKEGEADLCTAALVRAATATDALEAALPEAKTPRKTPKRKKTAVQEPATFDWPTELTNLADGLLEMAECAEVPSCVRGRLFGAERALRAWLKESLHTADCGSAKGDSDCYHADGTNTTDDNGAAQEAN